MALIHQAMEVDPISKFKVLIPRLKEVLATLMKVAGEVFYQNSQFDECVRHGENNSGQIFDKTLEEFYAICDQIELNLRMALECVSQSTDSSRNTPVPVTIQNHTHKSDPQQQQSDTQSYPQYLSTVHTQIACAKEIHDSLLVCANKISEKQMSTT
ncbi:Mediator of RNA polymerase II transcription subunit 29 [Lamellibrachia satsuma]|nr:Mediator of RNA polymerase II transcription subunit 29 [Lamellibrachia satsuma]